MMKTLTIRLASILVLKLKAKAKTSQTNPTAVFRQMVEEYVREGKPLCNITQEHIRAHAGSWKGFCSGEELLRSTRR